MNLSARLMTSVASFPLRSLRWRLLQAASMFQGSNEFKCRLDMARTDWNLTLSSETSFKPITTLACSASGTCLRNFERRCFPSFSNCNDTRASTWGRAFAIAYSTTSSMSRRARPSSSHTARMMIELCRKLCVISASDGTCRPSAPSSLACSQARTLVSAPPLSSNLITATCIAALMLSCRAKVAKLSDLFFMAMAPSREPLGMPTATVISPFAECQRGMATRNATHERVQGHS
mmetsp:Transcript_16692/g.63225  ORF Transcript_16692/g.63225 Transcript_16692/m.63225 type:complete len:234 (-) Transcript_16692:12-713(-)